MVSASGNFCLHHLQARERFTYMSLFLKHLGDSYNLHFTTSPIANSYEAHPPCTEQFQKGFF